MSLKWWQNFGKKSPTEPITEQNISAKVARHLEKSMKQENSTYEKIVTNLEDELELSGLEAGDELQVNTLSQHATNMNADKPKPTCHLCKKSLCIRESNFANWKNLKK